MNWLISISSSDAQVGVRWGVSEEVDTYMLFSKAAFLSSSLSTVADHWLPESSIAAQISSPSRVLTLDLWLWKY